MPKDLIKVWLIILISNTKLIHKELHAWNTEQLQHKRNSNKLWLKQHLLHFSAAKSEGNLAYKDASSVRHTLSLHISLVQVQRSCTDNQGICWPACPYVPLCPKLLLVDSSVNRTLLELAAMSPQSTKNTPRRSDTPHFTWMMQSVTWVTWRGTSAYSKWNLTNVQGRPLLLLLFLNPPQHLQAK